MLQGPFSPRYEHTHETRPGRAIYNADNTHLMVQTEVESNNNQAATIRKLQYGLVDQLRYQRNADTSITACTGFYFPNVVKRCVIEVTVEWNDHYFTFIVN